MMKRFTMHAADVAWATTGALALAPARALIAQKVQITGAGATFPYPIYSKWFTEYNKLHPNVEINYQSIGSGGGIRQITNQTVFFGATDGPMTDEQLLAAPGKILHFPTVLGAVVPVYNIPGVTAELKFTGPGARRHLPRQDHEVERSGDRQAESRREAAGDRHHRRRTARTARARPTSGSTTWRRSRRSGRRKVGVATVGELAGRRRRQGQRGRRRAREADAGLDRLRRADLRAPEQDRVRRRCRTRPASSCARRVESVTAAAAAAAAKMPADFRVSITNAPGKDAYPISSFTWLLLYENPRTRRRRRHGGFREVGAWPTARSSRRSSDTRRCQTP